MPEFRKIIEPPAVKLDRNDVEQLAMLMTENIPQRPRSFEFALTFNDAQYSAETIEELFQQNIPATADSLSFTIRGWNDVNNIDRGITLSLRKTIGDYQIHSLDEVWFKGKIQQLNDFFNSKRPWYSVFRKYLPGIIGFSQGIVFLAIIFFMFSSSFILAATAGITLYLLSWGFRKYLSGDLFPKTKIMLHSRQKNDYTNVLMLIFTAIGALSTLTGVIVQIYLTTK